MNRVSGSSWIAGILLSGAMAIALPGAALAIEIYKWVDENGVTHYSNIKPTDAKWKVVPEDRISVIPGARIGAEAARAAERERTGASRGASQNEAVQAQLEALQQARAQRREELLQECARNNGVDCSREVDTELRAEGLQQGPGVIRTVPPPASAPPATPATGAAPSSPASSLR